jgi:hypothetical protein
VFNYRQYILGLKIASRKATPFFMFQPQHFLHALRTDLSHLEGGDPVGQAYALRYLARVVEAALPFAPKTVAARPRPTTEAVSLTLGFGSDFRLQVTTQYPQAAQVHAPHTILSVFRHDRLQVAYAVKPEQLAASITRALQSAH